MSSHWNDVPADVKGNNGASGLGLAPKAAAATSSVNTQNVSGTGASSAPANPTATVMHEEAVSNPPKGSLGADCRGSC